MGHSAETCGFGAEEKSRKSGELDRRILSRQKAPEVCGRGWDGGAGVATGQRPGRALGTPIFRSPPKDKASGEKLKGSDGEKTWKPRRHRSQGGKAFPRGSSQRGQIRQGVRKVRTEKGLFD